MSGGGPSLQLSDYLEKLSGTTFRKLYQEPSTAFAIFRRMLPHLAKTFVTALLYMPDPMLQSDIEDTWARPGAKPQASRALSTLRSLHMIQFAGGKNGKPVEMQLSTNFKNSMRLALEGGGSHGSFGVPSTLPVDTGVDVAFLDRYARKKWEDILQYVVYSVGDYGGSGSGQGPKTSVKNLLMAGGLVERRHDFKSGMGITQTGFTFLLQEANAQVWTLLLLWLDMADNAKKAGGGVDMDSVDMLSFLFMLASLELGRAYDTDALTEARRNMLPSLVDFGLIYIPRDPRQYFPTRLATTLTSNATALRSMSAGFAANVNHAPGDASSLGMASSEVHKGSVIIETNHRLYAYTSSPLQIAVLNLFASMDMRFGAMMSGRVSRESIRKAIRHGITADQIVAYLQAHAHEQMARAARATGKALLPPTVVDQIRLWQLENERMRTTPGFLFKDMTDTDEYMQMAAYAETVGVLVWRNDEKKVFFASKTEQLRDWLKARKK